MTALPPERNRMRPDHAPTPFHADDIRSACPAGRISTYRFEGPGKPPVLETTRFVACDERERELETTTTDLDGRSVEETRLSRGTWIDLQSHASWPDADTTIEAERIETPAGPFDCWLYSIRGEHEDRPAVTKAWFARSLPGPPVRMTLETGGETVLTMSLVEHRLETPHEGLRRILRTPLDLPSAEASQGPTGE